MSDPVTEPPAKRPAICLNMTVQNQGRNVRELLDTAARYISSWVIVDTGSADGTPELIRNQLARLGIPGVLYERPWRSVAQNRTEALTLAQGHGDYIWAIAADDMIVGNPDFTQLTGDVYWLRYKKGANSFWRAQVFRDGLRVHFAGTVHERAAWDDPYTASYLIGGYHIEFGHRGTHARDLQESARDRALLLAEVERHPTDPQSVFSLAENYFDLGDFTRARDWYKRRVELGGADEEVYLAQYRIAQAKQELGEPWRAVQDAYLQAWDLRPTRAEPLWALAAAHRIGQRYQLGYPFAKRAAEIPLPDADHLFVRDDVYAWRATDEQAVCASWINKHSEAFTLWRRLLARPDIPEEDRRRIASNRDVCVPTMIDLASRYPYAVVHALQRRAPGPAAANVVVSVLAGPDLTSTEQTLNSFLRCCLDVSRVDRFLVLDVGMAPEDRALLVERYPFLELVHPGPGTPLARIRAQLNERFWLHLGQHWRFFAPEHLITRLTAVLEAEEQVFRVVINANDSVIDGPAMFDIARLDRAGDLRTASLDEVFCSTEVRHAQQSDNRSASHSQDRRHNFLPRITGIVLDEWKIIYVITPKAMCTSMLWFLMELQNKDLSRDVTHSRSAEVTRRLAVHDPAVWRRTRLLHSLPEKEVERIISADDWFRFGFTRHPVDRLWSAWQSKLLLREPTPTAVYGAASWFPRAPRELPRGAAALDAIAADFGTFVAALAEDPQLVTTDPHWAPQSYQLRPEAFPYSEIGRVEASTVTVDRLERHLQEQGWTGTLTLERLNATLLPRAIVRDPAVLRLIEKTYADDMAAFGYEPATLGQPPSADAGAVAVQALVELVDRHERLGDLHQMLAPEYYAGSPEWFSTVERSST